MCDARRIEASWNPALLPFFARAIHGLHIDHLLCFLPGSRSLSFADSRLDGVSNLFHNAHLVLLHLGQVRLLFREVLLLDVHGVVQGSLSDEHVA